MPTSLGALQAAEPAAALRSPAASAETLAQFEIPANPGAPATPKDPLLFSNGPWSFKVGVFAGSQLVLEDNAYWGLAEIFAADSRYDKDRVWNEAWLIPSLRGDLQLSKLLGFYAGLAVAATGNIGRDLFDQGNEGQVSLENAFGGVRIGGAQSQVSLDLSGGQQPYRLGSGFLLYLGAQNGNQRGAALVSPRISWKDTGIAKFTAGRFAADAFL